MLPEYWAEKAHSHPAGIFINNFYQFQVALNLAAHGDNPYEGLYHEYYHSVTMPYFPSLPTWVAEGMADFYGNSVIRDKAADVGLPNPLLVEELRSTPLIPLSVLLKVDHTSPYYNEQSKVSIFYAESWALIHYLMLGDHGAHRDAFGAYLSALNQGAGQDEAASKAFGDLRKFQENLERYLTGLTLPAIQIPVAEKVADSEVTTHILSPAEVDAYCGGFLELHNQFQQAQPLLNEATQLDSKLALAQRNLGLLHYFRKERANALASFSAAIALDPRDPMTRYLRAQLTYSDVSRTDPQIEADLRQSLQLKPDFAAANGLLAIYLAEDTEKLPEAFAFGQKAVSLEPGNLSFHLNLAQILVRMRRYDDAETIAHRVRAAAMDEAFRTQSDQLLTYIGQARDRDVRPRQMQADSVARAAAPSLVPRLGKSSNETAAPPVDSSVQAPLVTHIDGVPTQVRCSGNAIDLTLKVDGQPAPLTFHIDDRTGIGYTSEAIHEDLDPCTELSGRTIRIVYAPSAPNALQGRVVQIEVEK